MIRSTTAALLNQESKVTSEQLEKTAIGEQNLCQFCQKELDDPVHMVYCLTEEGCSYCGLEILKAFMGEHIEECLGYIEFQFKRLELEVIECSVCCIEMEELQDRRILSCQHQFHHECIEQWLLKKKECPYCRTLVK